MAIGDRLREERERLGYSQPEFAGFAGTAKQTLFSWESGHFSPKADQLSALAGANLEQALATEMQSVNARYATDIGIKQDRLKQARDDLAQASK